MIAFFPDAIRTVTEHVWTEFLGCPVIPEVDHPEEPVVQGQVLLRGAWAGVISVRCSEPLARFATSRMFGIPGEEVGSEEMQDAMDELANMTGGNLKALLPTPCDICLPPGDPAQLGRTRVVGEVRFECNGEPLYVVMAQFSGADRNGDRPAPSGT